jgi:Ca2+-binding RTX toxin-like protein
LADTLRGGGGDDTIFAGSGNDRLFGEAGADTLNGMKGHDFLRGGTGNDTLVGGTGVDTADYGLATARVVVNLGTGRAAGTTIGSDTLIQIENAAGGSGADALAGWSGANTLIGNAGADELTGRGGLDRLTGGRGTRDDFNYLAINDSTGTGDLITDFEPRPGQWTCRGSARSSFTFSGQRRAFNTATAPELRYVQDAANNLTHVYADVNGDDAADMHIRLAGVLTLSAGDSSFEFEGLRRVADPLNDGMHRAVRRARMEM